MYDTFSHSRKMLTGLEPPTSGDIEIMGFKYPQEWKEIQKLIGLCPQYSILYPDLTPKEHLMFYGELKQSSSRTDLTDEVEQ